MMLSTFKKFLFIFGCAGFSLLQGLSLVAASGGLLSRAVHGLLIEVASLGGEHGLEGVGSSSCHMWAQQFQLPGCGTWGQ